MEIFLTVLIYVVVIALIITGIISIFVPFLPDIFFILLAFFIYGIYDRFEHISFWAYLLLVGLALIVVIIDYLSTIIGAKKFGVSRWGLLYGVIGGIIGILIGWGGSKLLSKIFATEVTLWSVALSFSFATLVGVVFGIAPAIKASKKDPIEALRYE